MQEPAIKQSNLIKLFLAATVIKNLDLSAQSKVNSSNGPPKNVQTWAECGFTPLNGKDFQGQLHQDVLPTGPGIDLTGTWLS